MDLRKVLTEGVLVVTNTHDRIEELKNRIEKILESDSLPAAEASQLRGRLGFSNSQTFGREGAYAYLALGQRACSSDARTKLSPDLRQALRWWLDHVATAKPRKVKLSRNQTPVYLFTDGSCEGEGGTFPKAEIGAVIYDPVDGFADAFGGELPQEVVAKFSPGGAKRQVV